MVLRPRRLVPVLAVLLFGGCLAHPQVMRLSQQTPVLAAYVVDDPLVRKSEMAPAEVTAKIDAALAARNLVVKHVDEASWLPRLSRVRSTRARLDALAKAAGGAPYVLLVELSPSFYSQMNGRYRWTVDLTVTVSPSGDPSMAVDGHAELPAFLLYDHERGDAAVREVAGQIVDRVGSVVDDLLAGQNGAAPVPATGGGGGGAIARPPEHASWRPAPPPADDVVYFVMVDRFADGDHSNDAGVDRKDPRAWHGGDVAGLIDHLDWLEKLGVRTVWLSPVYLSRHAKLGRYGAFHGYWVFDHMRPDPRFGSFAELRRLSDALHARHMRLLLDVVVNHVGYDAPLVKTHPDWFHHEGDITDWNDPEQLVRHDVHGLPDLAQEKPAVYAYLMRSARVWIDRVHPDGFRLDAVKHVPLTFWRRYDAALRRYAGPGFFLLGEDLDGDAAHLAHTERAGRFSSLFDFPLHFALVDVLCKGKSPGRIASVLSLDRLYPDATHLVTLLDNHDLPRIRTACGGDEAKVARALSMLLSLRGIPSITWGTEVGLAGKSAPENRADMRFDASAPLVSAISGDVAFRRAHPALERGLTRVVKLSGSALALLRLTESDAVLVSLNTGTAAAQIPLPAGLVAAADPKALPSGDTVTVAAGDVDKRALPPRAANGYAALVATWRREGTLGHPGPARPVEISVSGAPKGTVVVGAGPELGSWDPAHGVPVDAAGVARLKVPAGIVVAYKLAVRSGGKVTWAAGANRYLRIPAGRGVVADRVSWGGAGGG